MNDCRQGETKSVWNSFINDLSTMYKQREGYTQRHIDLSGKIGNISIFKSLKKI